MREERKIGTMLEIIQAQTDEHKRHVKDLFWEYLTWTNTMLNQEFKISFDMSMVLEADLIKLHQFVPPSGRLLMAKYQDKIVGCVCLKKISEDIGEIKRMYVQPNYRRKGIGSALLAAIIEEARFIGYSKIRLDSACFAKKAQTLYRSFGFKDIEPYPESELPKEYHSHWAFMEMALQ